MRERLGLTLRDVEAASARLAEIHNTPELAIVRSRISEIETKGMLPNIYRLYSFAVIYRSSIRELMKLFGLDIDRIPAQASVIQPRGTHKAASTNTIQSVRIPMQIDPAFDPSTTTNMGRMIMRWGLVPMAFLEQFETADYTYGYIGTEDFTMYPLLLPGSFLQIDETKRKVVDQVWRSEYERPIYFVDTREGYTCCWCEQDGLNTTLLHHPLSPVKARSLRSDRDIEILGQVVGVAMRLDEWTTSAAGAASAKPLKSI